MATTSTTPTNRPPAAWHHARGHVAFVVGVALATAIAVSLEARMPRHDTLAGLAPAAPASALPRPPLSPGDLRTARAAWAYLVVNTRPTGLVDAVHNYPAGTMWDQASALLGTLAARRLGLVGQDEARNRLAKTLATLAKLPLVDQMLPNKSYDTRSGVMTDYANKPTPRGIGWSALDIGRMAVALRAIELHEPGLAPAVAAVVARWRWSAAVHDGDMWGLQRESGADVRPQEGRLGYAQYGARGFQVRGLDPWEAVRPELHTQWVSIEGVQVPVDDRAAGVGGHVFAASEPFVLDGLEFGLQGPMGTMARASYAAQQARAEHTGVLTAASEDHLDRAPYFVYNTVWADGRPWACITDKGEDRPNERTLSAKAALGWAALFPGPYADRLRAAVAGLVRDGEGVQAGRYEATGTPNAVLALNTNAVILEALAYQAHGPLLAEGR